MSHRKMLATAALLLAQTAGAEDYFSPKSLYEAAKSQERSNPSEAVSLYNSSAKGGYLPAQLLVAGLHRSGIGGVEQSCQKSIYWYERAAEQDSTDAIVELASIYADDKDQCYAPEKSVALYKEAANNGNGQAQQSLALLYIQGKGVKKDLVSAHVLLSASMKNGVYKSSLNLREFIEKHMTPTEIEKAKTLAKTNIKN